MLKFLFIVAVLLAAEFAATLSLTEYEGWKITLAQVLLTGCLGVLVIRCTPSRWKQAMRKDPAWLWADLSWTAEHVDAHSREVDERMRDWGRRGYLLLLAGILLIFPGVLTDTAGFLLLAWVVILSLRRRPSSSLTASS